MSVITMKELLEAGVHFGHRTRRWNPKMRPYIFTERSGIHIIDLHQTMLQIESAYEDIRNIITKGGTVLFVGTKRQAQAAVQEEAERAGMPYVNLRWLGGTITNWSTIKQRINYLLKLERRWDAGEFVNLTKREQLTITREMEKLNRRLGGLKVMTKLPDALFVVDTHNEDLAVREAVKLGIPIYGMVDTNSDPDQIHHVIPCNDDAIRSVKLIVKVIASAAEEGARFREIDMADSGQVTSAELNDMEQYLGPSTIARLREVEDDEVDASSAAANGSGESAVAVEAAAGDVTQDGSAETSEAEGVELVESAETVASVDTQEAEEVSGTAPDVVAGDTDGEAEAVGESTSE